MVKTKKANITTTTTIAENADGAKEAVAAVAAPATTPAPAPKENSEENVVYVFPSKQTEHIPSTSPECMAVETYLRFRKINYKYATDKCVEKPHGEPVIILNQKEYVGFDKIDEAVASQPALTGGQQEAVIFPELNSDQQADCQAYIYALVDTVLYQVLYVQRFKHTTPTTAEFDIIKRFKSGFQRLFKVNKDEDRLTKLKPEQLGEIVKDALNAINNYLKRDNDKQYFFGDKPTKHDAILFGLLAQYWQEPPTGNGQSTADFSLSSLLEAGEGAAPASNKITAYLENIRAVYWPDWQERCAKPPPPPPVASPSKRSTFRKSKSEQHGGCGVAAAAATPAAAVAADAPVVVAETNGVAAAAEVNGVPPAVDKVECEKTAIDAQPPPTTPAQVEVKVE